MRTPRKVWTEYQDAQEKNNILQEFLDKAYRNVPVKAIIKLLTENRNAWFGMTVGKGNEYLPIGDYSEDLLKATGGDPKDVFFCYIILKKSEVVLFEKLRVNADFYEFSSVFEEHLHLALFFIKT